MLLHGDLHQDNILAVAREPWLAIDPKGLVGEPAYEGGSLLRNPQDQLLALPDPKPLLARRVAQLADALQGQPTRDSGSEQSSWVAGHGTAIDSTARWS